MLIFIWINLLLLNTIGLSYCFHIHNNFNSINSKFNYNYNKNKFKNFNIDKNVIIAMNTKQVDVITSNANEGKKTFDFKAVLSYVSATTLQWNLIKLTLTFINNKILPYTAQFDIIVSNISKYFNQINKAQISFLPKFEFYPRTSSDILSSLIVIGLFFFLSIRSRIFSPLDNSRPKASKNDPIFKDRIRPSWQPPAIAFPIIWTTISILRTISAYLIYKSTNSLISKPLLFFFAHLSIGDTWNTINNIENRLGTASLGVLFVLLSVYLTTYEYYKIFPMAGYILSPSCLWLSIATVLVFTIWKINYIKSGKPSFYPSIEEGPLSKWRIPLLQIKL